MILAIDPGPEQSAYVLYNGERPVSFGKMANWWLLDRLQAASENGKEFGAADCLAVEMIASYGMPVGAEVFETCVWIGRFVEAWGRGHTMIYRRLVKQHLCGSMKAKDANVRQALIDAWGGKEKAIGTSKAPGPLRGIKADVWSALAVAVTYADRLEQCDVT